MSFYPQPNEWICGPFALKYALVMHGLFENEMDISIKAGTNWWNGTNELSLTKAAKSYNCTLKSIRRIDEEKARLTLNKYLRKKLPCILCVDNWEHWITVINYDKSKYIIVDSQESPVIQIYSWRKLKNRWIFKDPQTNKSIFDFYPLVPNFKRTNKPKFDIVFAQELRKDKNRDLAQNWDKYFSHLIEICKEKNPNSIHHITVTEFFRRYSKMIIDEVIYWNKFPTQRELKNLLKRFEIVAKIYNLVIPVDRINEAISAFSSILTIYSCDKYGSQKIFSER